MEEGIDKEYAELVSLMRKLHGVFNDKKFRTACRTVLDGLERAHGCFQAVAAYKGMDKCDKVYNRLKRLGKKRTADEEDTLDKCEKMYDMRASVFSGPGWIYTRPMYKSAKQCASALKRVLVEEEIGVGNALAFISGDIDNPRKYAAKEARDYKELDKRVKEFVIR